MLDAELWDAARRAFSLANTKRLAVRSVSLTLDRLMETEAQLDLWEGGQSLPREERGADRRTVGRIGGTAVSPNEETAKEAALRAKFRC